MAFLVLKYFSTFSQFLSLKEHVSHKLHSVNLEALKFIPSLFHEHLSIIILSYLEHKDEKCIVHDLKGLIILNCNLAPHPPLGVCLLAPW